MDVSKNSMQLRNTWCKKVQNKLFMIFLQKVPTSAILCFLAPFFTECPLSAGVYDIFC